MKRALLLIAFLLTGFAMPAFAVNPDEVLSDPALETRARDLSTGLRCLVCRNQSIDDSNAELARDLRLLLRERLMAGDSDEEAIAYLVERYGNYILLQPPFNALTLLLWVSPIVLFLGALLGFRQIWHRPLPPNQMTEGHKDMTEDDRLLVAAVLSGEDEI